MQWASWYVGPITLTLAIVGAAYATCAFVRGSLALPSEVAALVLGPPALLYLWQPSITPDQIWAMRRFLPAVFPMLVLAAFGALCVLAGRDRFGRAGARRAVAVVLGVLAVAYPVYAIRERLADDRSAWFPARRAGRVPHRRQARRDRRAAGGRAAHVAVRPADVALVLRRSGRDHVVGSEVGAVDAAARRQARPAAAAHARGEWAQQNRQLFIVAGNARTIRKLFPGDRAHRAAPTRTRTCSCRRS